MGGKLLFVASTRSHILHFHLPYLRGLREKGWVVHGAWSGASEEDAWADKVLPLPFEKKMSSRKNFRAARILRGEIRREGYDVVIVHTSLAAFFTRLAVMGLKDRPRVINMVHGYLFDDQTPKWKRGILLAAEGLTAPVTDLLLTMNQWDYETAGQYRLGKRVAHVPGVGVEFARLEGQRTGDPAALRRSLGIPADAFVLIYPAEFSARKSQEILLRAMTALPENMVLVLPGAGAGLEACKALAGALGVAERVKFPGYVSEMGPWYEMADAAVSSSRSEGLPFNIMEAMYSGLPVVASKVKGHTDLIRHGGSGLLYPYGDWQSCAGLVRQLMDDPALARSLARRGREEMDRYSLSRVYPRVMAQYESVMEPRPNG